MPAVATKNNGKSKTAAASSATTQLTIPPPNMQTAVFTITGTAPFVQNKFSAKARQQMRDQQAEGSSARNRKKREPKDFQAIYEASIHRDTREKWAGIPASCFRNAMISACRVAGFAMTKAKLSIFVEADGLENDGGEPTPLIRITGEPSYFESAVRNESGVADIRPRAMWAPGWTCKLRVRWDGDQFKIDDIANLLERAGQQVGIGEGRPDSKKSNGMGWGLFTTEER